MGHENDADRGKPPTDDQGQAHSDFHGAQSHEPGSVEPGHGTGDKVRDRVATATFRAQNQSNTTPSEILNMDRLTGRTTLARRSSSSGTTRVSRRTCGANSFTKPTS